MTGSPARARFSSVAEVMIGWPQELMRDVALGPRDAVLVFTHDSKFDEPALLAALATDAGYIGALGSRQTTVDRERRLRAAGADDADIDADPRAVRAGHRQPHRRGDRRLGAGRDHLLAGRAGRDAAA